MFAFIPAAPALVKILGSLLIILAINRVLKNLGLSILAGAFLLALWKGQAPVDALLEALGALLRLDSILLMVVIALVITLSSLMARSGVMRDLVGSVRSRLPKKLSLAALPSVIGLLPMPGGALFSAPLVDDIDTDKSIPAADKTLINYWFRHMWEPWWPLYPGIILAVGISGLALWQYVLATFPLSIVGVTAGWWFLLRSLPSERRTNEAGTVHPLILLAPILVVLGTYGVLLVAAPRVGDISRYLPVGIGLVFAVAFSQLTRPVPMTEWPAIARSGQLGPMLLIIVGITVYGNFIASPLPGGGLLMDQLKNDLATFGVPPVILMILLPFVAALTTGITLGFVGTAFPIIMHLLGPSPALGSVLATTVLGYGSGYIGMMLSPIHVCFVVSNGYFKTPLALSIPRLLGPTAAVLAGALAASAAYRVIF